MSLVLDHIMVVINTDDIKQAGISLYKKTDAILDTMLFRKTLGYIWAIFWMLAKGETL